MSPVRSLRVQMLQSARLVGAAVITIAFIAGSRAAGEVLAGRPMSMAPLVLVLEDDFEVQGLIAEFLDQCGYRIAAANERSVGEAILRNTKPALMIADVTVNGGDCFGLLRMAEGMGVKVLLISGEPQSVERLEGGPLPFLHKPFRLADLHREMKRLLKPQDEEVAKPA